MDKEDKDQTTIPTCEDCDFTCVGDDEDNIYTNDCLDNWECDYTVYPNSKVDIESSDGFTDGDYLVFKVALFSEGSALIADDEFWHNLVFELPTDQNSFSVEASELEDMQAHFKRVCFCPSVEYLPVSMGCLQGEKNEEGVWFVQGNITVSYDWGDLETKFDAYFSE